MSSKIEKAILRTLAYSDIFDYPLTKEEIWKYLISNKPVKKELFEQALSRHSGKVRQGGPHPESPIQIRDPGHIRLRSVQEPASRQARMTIGKKGNFYFLKNRLVIVQIRHRREKESIKKIRIAKKVAGILSKIPTVQLIGLSGALAMNNSEKDDDIDFFIITSENCLWITRMLSLIFLQILGYRRRRREKNVSNKICLNMFVSDGHLSLPKQMQDLYTAHELLQMKVLFDRNNTDSRFMSSNKWVRKYLINSVDIKGKEESPNILISQYLNIFEKLARKIQLLSIKRHQTTEIVSDTLLAFHPTDYRKFMLKEYNKRLVIYKLV